MVAEKNCLAALLGCAARPGRCGQKGEFLFFFLLSSPFGRQGPAAIPAKGRIFGYFLAFFSLRPPGAGGDSGEKENFRPFSCFLLPSAAGSRRRFR